MKPIVIVLSFFAFLLFSCNFENSVSYNDTIIKPQLEVITKLDSIYAGPEVSIENIRKHREELVADINSAMKEIRNLKDFKGNTSFREAAMKYFSHLNFLYEKTNNIDSLIYKFNSQQRVDNMNEKDYDFMQRELNKYLELENTLLDEQKKFAQQFNMKLQY